MMNLAERHWAIFYRGTMQPFHRSDVDVTDTRMVGDSQRGATASSVATSWCSCMLLLASTGFVRVRQKDRELEHLCLQPNFKQKESEISVQNPQKLCDAVFAPGTAFYHQRQKMTIRVLTALRQEEDAVKC